MNMMKSTAALIVLVASATPLAAQVSRTVPSEGLVIRQASNEPGLVPTRQEIGFGGKKSQAGVGSGVHGDRTGDTGDAPRGYPPDSETAAVTYILRWERPVEITGFTQVAGKVEGDISNGLGYGAVAASAESECKYAGQKVRAADEESLALTTAGTPMIIGMSVRLFGFQMTMFLDSPTKTTLPISDNDAGTQACTTSATITLQAKGSAGMVLYRPAKGAFDYTATAGALVIVSGFCPFHDMGL